MTNSNQDTDDFFDDEQISPAKTSIFRMSSKSDISDEENTKSRKSNSPSRSWSQTSIQKSNSISDTESDVSSLSSYTSDSSNYDITDNQTARYESSLDTHKLDCSPTKQVIDDIWKTTSKSRSRSCSRSNSWSSEVSVSDSDVTDVSPLNSPCIISAKVNNRYATSNNSKSSLKREQNESRASPNLNLLNARSDKMDLRLLMEAVAEMEQTNNENTVFFRPKGRAQKDNAPNYSFRRDKVKEIDTENRRLLQKILNYAKRSESDINNIPPNNSSHRSRPMSAVSSQTAASTMITASRSVIRQQRTTAIAKSHLTPSSVNRGKDQRRIENDNKTLLKRIQTTKATSTLRRDSLLNDYNKMQIGGISLSSVHLNSAKRRMKASRPTSNATFRPQSATMHSTPATTSRNRPISASGSIMRSAMSNRRPISATMQGKSKRRDHRSVQVAWEDGW